jgi:aldehyde:ferredoxin oxidoreductase
MKQRKIISEFKYTPGKVEKGYAGRSLYVNVGTGEICSKEVTGFMKDKFVGGKGFDLWYLWNAVTPETKWDSPENEIVISSGPVGGITQYPGAGKSIVTTISPIFNTPFDSNAGGYFGPLLKFAGFDALELQGKAASDVIVYIDGHSGKVTLEKCWCPEVDAHLIGEEITEVLAKDELDKRNISVVSAGSAADHTNIGMLNFSFYDERRKAVRLKQAGRGGIGRVFRDKKIKAVVVYFPDVRGDLNNPADLAVLQKTGVKYHKHMHDEDENQNGMRKIGTANIVEVMDRYDLLPVRNYQYGADPETKSIASTVFIKDWITQGIHDGCWYGCTMSCAKAADNFEVLTGPYKGTKVTVDGPEYENVAALASNCGIFCPQYTLEANFYCDTYSVDTISFGTLMAFAMECFERGLINKEVTGGLELKFGAKQECLEVLHQMSRGEGFGLIAGQGVRYMKKVFAEKYGADPKLLHDIGMEGKGLEVSEYMPKESLAQQGGYFLTNKGPQHDEAWLIFMDQINNQIPTFDDKADALHYFPMWRTWFGLVGLCKLVWNDIIPKDNHLRDEPAKIPQHVENYVSIYNAVTGKNIDIEQLI